MESMIERVGRAIFASQDWPEFHPAYENSAKEIWEVAAKEAIEAMREPSQKMLMRAWNLGELCTEEAKDHWDVMIDEALKEE